MLKGMKAYIDSFELMDAILNSANLTEVNEDFSIIEINNKNFLPFEINEIIQEDNINTPENQFFKYFLEYLEMLIKELLSNISFGYAYDKLKDFEKNINYFLSFNFFNEISNIKYLPLNSQVLHKKEGYKEILDYFLMLNLDFRISWEDLTNNFESYQKQLQKLYEYPS